VDFLCVAVQMVNSRSPQRHSSTRKQLQDPLRLFGTTPIAGPSVSAAIARHVGTVITRSQAPTSTGESLGSK